MAITVDLIQLDGTNIPSNWNIGVANFIRVDLKLTVTSPHNKQVIDGEVYKNGAVIARFNRTATGILTQNWFAGARQPIYVNDGDLVSVKVVSPITVLVEKTIMRGGQDIAGDRSYSSCIKKSEYFLQGREVDANDVLKEVIDDMKTYTDISYTQRPAENVSNVVRYVQSEVQLPPITINIFNNSSDLQEALDSIRPVTQKDIFQTWPRFNFPVAGTPQQFWLNPAQATGGAAQWQWQENNQRVYMPVNQSFWSGFISDKKYDRYDHEMTTGSTDGDDDWNAVIIAHVWEGGINHILMLIVSPQNNNNTWSGSASGANLVAYHGGKLQLHSNPPSHWDSTTYVQSAPNDPRPNGGWSGKERRVGIQRRGDEVTIRLSNWNQSTYDDKFTFTINLNARPEFAIFKGPQSYGYTNMSQGASYYKDLFFDGGERTDTITYAPTGEVYTYNPADGWVVEQGLSLTQIYGAPRELISETTGQRFMLNVNGTITPIN